MYRVYIDGDVQMREKRRWKVELVTVEPALLDAIIRTIEPAIKVTDVEYVQITVLEDEVP